MLQKLVVIEPVPLVQDAIDALARYAGEIVFFKDIPADDAEIIRRIGDADGVLLSYTSSIKKNVLENCPNIRYIGMCCSLYSEESANVDIRTARQMGITVLGIRDYGDEGVTEYAVSELVRFLHGIGGKRWKEKPMEITGLKVGVIGMGTTGTMITKMLQFFGAQVCYFSRTRKPEWEKNGVEYQPLHSLLESSEIVFTCLNKNVILLKDEEFSRLGNGKILFNTSIGPSFDLSALRCWLDAGNNHFFCDSDMALGDPSGTLLAHPNVHCTRQTAGVTTQASRRLSQKVLDNIELFLK